MKTESYGFFGKEVDLVIKARRVIAQLRAVALVQKISGPVMPAYPADMPVSPLVGYGLAQDPDSVRELAVELRSLIEAYGHHLEDYEVVFAKRIYAELIDLQATLDKNRAQITSSA